MRILAIDPGTVTTGFAVLECVPSIRVVYSATYTSEVAELDFRTDILGSRWRRISQTCGRLQQLLDLYTPEVVASESPYLGRFPQSFQALVELLTMLRNTTVQWNAYRPLNLYDPATVKGTMGVPGNSGDKQAMFKALDHLQLHYASGISPNMFDEHTVDAICVGLTAWRLLNT